MAKILGAATPPLLERLPAGDTVTRLRLPCRDRAGERPVRLPCLASACMTRGEAVPPSDRAGSASPPLERARGVAEATARPLPPRVNTPALPPRVNTPPFALAALTLPAAMGAL